MGMTMFCPRCEVDRDCQREVRQETYDVRGEKIALDVPAWVCPVCGESMVEASFGDPIEKVYEAYRKKHGLLTSEEIAGIRERWGLSQVAFASLLGMSQATINRYERGSLQQQKEDELIRAFGDAGHMRDALPRRGHLLTRRQRKAIEDALSQATSPLNERRWEFELEESGGRELSEFNGFRAFSFERYAAIVVWFSKCVSVLTQTKLYKLLFYSDFLAYKTSSVSLTGTMYRAMPHGPVPADFGVLRGLMEIQDLVVVNEKMYQNGNVGEEFSAGPKADELADILGEEELRILESVRDQLGGDTPSQVSDRSHREDAWKDTPQKQLISYAKARTLSVEMP
ncbi:MAG: DUF4065 domain-containing protein [Phycisphaeraceae bacterium]|nr:DUF4065 domain-containing protein [Phycisphaeraceae bacterium]